MQKWQYLTIPAERPLNHEELQTFGDNGWELAAVVPLAEGEPIPPSLLQLRDDVTGSATREGDQIETGPIHQLLYTFKQPK